MPDKLEQFDGLWTPREMAERLLDECIRMEGLLQDAYGNAMKAQGERVAAEKRESKTAKICWAMGCWILVETSVAVWMGWSLWK